MRRNTRNALLLSLLTAVAALATAGVAEAWGAVPDHVEVAQQLVGDAGEYRYVRLGRDGAVEVDQVATTFRWLAPQAVRDADGELRTANTLAVDRRYYADDGQVHNVTFTTYVDPVDRDEDLGTVAVDGEITATPLVPMLPTLGESVDSNRIERLSIPDPDNGGLAGDQCGQWPLVGGRRLDLHDDVRLLAPCLGPLYWSDDLASVDWFLFDPDFRAVRTTQVDGRQAIVFQSVDYGGKVWAWLDPTIPYPLQVLHEHEGRQHLLRLSRFERGTTPLADRDLAEAPPAPKAILADRLPWGMDDAGVEHPFPLSTAWTFARDDPLASGMRDWMAAHPGWYTADARGRVADYGDLRLHEWKWVLADGTDSKTVGLVRQEDRNGGLGTLPVDGLVPARVTYRYDNASLYRGPVEYPPRDLVADQMTTLASLTSQWRAYSGSTAPLEGWGFRVWCSDCGRFVHADEWAGQYHFRRQEVGGGPLSIVSGMDLDYDVFERSGLVHGGELKDPNLSVERIQRDQAQLVLAGVPLTGQPASPPQGLALGGKWAAPDPLAVVAVGAFALLVFLAVRFGGAILGWPLFSRIQAPDLLAHPVRQAVHQAIEANPGIHLKALTRTVGRARNTVEHHVRKLVAAGLVTQHDLNGYACLFVKGQVDRREQAVAGALKSDAARRVLAAVVRAPGASGRSVASDAGLAPSLVSYHLQNLQKAGLLEGRRDGRALRLVATDLGRKSAVA